ncbi:SGNH/GDSL hydrolase family protein [Pseudomonas sp. IT-P218]|uniref:SGNH/GDSL hydrolase family protein n=1 Tax=Pseudomonas sp. IT-P218 TaxID=3026449 RepID=UPI0039DFD5D9
MADQTQRLEIATVKAEIGSDIIYRFSNDAIDAEGIPTDSGEIQNLKQVAEGIKVDGQEAVETAVAEGVIDLTDSVESASDSASRAELAANIAAATANQKLSIPDGLAATSGSGSTNRFFSVPGTGNTFSTQYRNDAGVAVEIGRVSSAEAVESVIKLINPVDGSVLYYFLDELGFAWGSVGSTGFDLPGMAAKQTVQEGTSMLDPDDFLIFDDGPDGSTYGAVSSRRTPGEEMVVTDELGFVWSDMKNPAGTKVAPIPSTIPLIASPICGVQGENTSIYVRNILAKRSDTNLVRGTFASRSTPEIITSTDELRFKTEDIGAHAYLYLRSELTSASRTRLTLNCLTAPNPGIGSGAILTLGDSIQNRQGGTQQKQFLEAWGYAPTFIGTIKGSSAIDDPDNATGELGEAREGWETGDFTYSVTDRVSMVAPGGEADYLNSPKLTKWQVNPFLRASTGGDDPSIVRNGRVFDPAFYQARFGLATPKIVNIALGTNNVRDRSTAEIYANAYSDLLLIVSQCKAAWPSAKIVMSCPSTPRDTARDVLWETKYVPLLQAMLQVRNDVASTNVLVFPVWAHVTQEAGYTITSPVTDPLTGAVTGSLGDAIHPRESTRQQMQKAYAKFFACALANLI